MNFDVANLNIKYMVDISSALLTPTVAIFAGIIAYQQWQTQEKQRKQDLFEKRYDKLFKLVLDNVNRYNMYCKDNFNNIDIKEKERLDKEFKVNFYKYKFLITKKDFEELVIIYNTIIRLFYQVKIARENIDEKDKQNNSVAIFSDIEKQLNNMDIILEKYLRVEKEPFSCLNFLSNSFKIRRRKNDL